MIPLVRRLKLGSAEIELQESAAKLHQSVEKAEGAIGILIKPPTVTTTRRFTMDSVSEALNNLPSTENSILDLASRDKESAVVRLAVEIEKELYALYGKRDPAKKSPRTIHETVSELVSDHILDRQLAMAITEFRDVRNRVMHPSQVGVVDQATLASAIDSGIRILRLLRTVRSLKHPGPIALEPTE